MFRGNCENFDRTLRADCPIDGTKICRVDASPFERSRLRSASVEPRVLHESRRILFGRRVIQSRVRGYEVCITRSGFTTHLKNFPTALGIERESRIFRSIYGYRLVLYEFGHATKSIEFH
jgi:hypothetical protein